MSPGGLEAIYFAHRPELLRFLRARGAGDAAEDLVQELWLKASKGASGPIQEPLLYLYRVANNLMIDRVRSEATAAQRGRDWTDATQGTGEASEMPSVEQTLLAREQLAQVRRTLESLGERTNEIFKRFRIDGVAQKRIAAEQGISIHTVEKHLQRAYRALVSLRRQHEGAEELSLTKGRDHER